MSEPIDVPDRSSSPGVPSAVLDGVAQPLDGSDLAQRLNRVCQCFTLDRSVLRRELEADEIGADLYRLIADGRANLFSDSVVFVGAREIERMAEIVTAVERVVATDAFRSVVLQHAPVTAHIAPAARGVFLGYDFHLGAAGPQLIEINTNAGGGMLNAVLARAQQACCRTVDATAPGSVGSATPESVFLEMFRQEWRLSKGDTPLTRIAIVDETPAEQYLYPEFVLFQRLFQRSGIDAVICDPEDLTFRDGALWFGAQRIDLVYNRLTDFGLEATNAAALREAYLSAAAVVTPHPRGHALYADKRNLQVLTDDDMLSRIGVDAATRRTLLSGIPHTEVVSRAQADSLWQRRRQLFFKPAAGFGSRAAYRGDKLTRRVFEEILDGRYVAQARVEPSARRIGLNGTPVELKVDLRSFVYCGQVQLVSARLYQGQTTNFRTPGGGFAPVLTVPCEHCAPVGAP